MSSSELIEGAIAAADVRGIHMIFARIGGEIAALSGTCTHEDADLGLGFLVEDRVVCPLHLSQFDLRTGNVLNPPAVASLRRFNTKTEGEMILVEV